MNATTFGTNKDFRKTVDIRQRVRHGKIERRIYLPPDEFSYGLPNKYIASFRDLLLNAHGNWCEDEIRHEYDLFIKEKTYRKPKPKKVIPRFVNPLVEEMKRREMDKKNLTAYGGFYGISDYNSFSQRNQKPLYKLKMFQDIPSKVEKEIKLFKTYHPYKHKKKKVDDIDHLINKVQGELQQNENCKNDKPDIDNNPQINCPTPKNEEIKEY